MLSGLPDADAPHDRVGCGFHDDSGDGVASSPTSLFRRYPKDEQTSHCLIGAHIPPTILSLAEVDEVFASCALWELSCPLPNPEEVPSWSKESSAAARAPLAAARAPRAPTCDCCCCCCCPMVLASCLLVFRARMAGSMAEGGWHDVRVVCAAGWGTRDQGPGGKSGVVGKNRVKTSVTNSRRLKTCHICPPPSPFPPPPLPPPILLLPFLFFFSRHRSETHADDADHDQNQYQRRGTERVVVAQLRARKDRARAPVVHGNGVRHHGDRDGAEDDAHEPRRLRMLRALLLIRGSC